MYSWSSSKSLCGSDLALFLTGGWLAIVRWVCNENLNTKSPPGILSPNCSLSQAKPVLCPRGREATRTCEAELELLGWLTIQWWAFTGGGMAIQPKSSNSASHVRFGGGFLGSWTDHRYCLRQSTNRAVDTRRVILCSGSHRTLIAQSWVRPPARNRFSSDPQRSASLPKEYTEIPWNSLKNQ